jgi:hypothetical protein
MTATRARAELISLEGLMDLNPAIDLRALPHRFAKGDELLRVRQCDCQWPEEC